MNIMTQVMTMFLLLVVLMVLLIPRGSLGREGFAVNLSPSFFNTVAAPVGTTSISDWQNNNNSQKKGVKNLVNEDRDDLLNILSCIRLSPENLQSFEETVKMSQLRSLKCDGKQIDYYAEMLGKYAAGLIEVQNDIVGCIKRLADRTKARVVGPVYALIFQAPYYRDAQGRLISNQNFNIAEYEYAPVNYQLSSVDRVRKLYYKVFILFPMHGANGFSVKGRTAAHATCVLKWLFARTSNDPLCSIQAMGQPNKVAGCLTHNYKGNSSSVRDPPDTENSNYTSVCLNSDKESDPTNYGILYQVNPLAIAIKADDLMEETTVKIDSNVNSTEPQSSRVKEWGIGGSLGDARTFKCPPGQFITRMDMRYVPRFNTVEGINFTCNGGSSQTIGSWDVANTAIPVTTISSPSGLETVFGRGAKRDNKVFLETMTTAPSGTDPSSYTCPAKFAISSASVLTLSNSIAAFKVNECERVNGEKIVSVKLTRPVTAGTSRDLHHLHIAEIWVYNKQGTKLVLSCEPTCASDWEPQTPPNSAIDNSLDTIFHSKYLNSPDRLKKDHFLHFRVKGVASASEVAKIIVNNRKNCCQDRLIGAYIELLENYAPVERFEITNAQTKYTFERSTDGSQSESYLLNFIAGADGFPALSTVHNSGAEFNRILMNQNYGLSVYIRGKSYDISGSITPPKWQEKSLSGYVTLRIRDSFTKKEIKFTDLSMMEGGNASQQVISTSLLIA